MLPSWMWVGGSLVLFFAVPFASSKPLPVRIAISAALLLTIVFAWWRTSSRGLSYFRGLDLIAKSFLSFDDNLTAIYLPFVLEAMHLAAIAFGVISLGRGRLGAQLRWYNLVESFYRRRTKEPLSKIAARPDADLPSLTDLLWGHASAVVESVSVPASQQPWYRRHLLLYAPRSGTVIYHIGFFLGLFGVVGTAAMYLFAPDQARPEDLGYGGAFCAFIAIASYIAVRREDAIHRTGSQPLSHMPADEKAAAVPPHSKLPR